MDNPHLLASMGRRKCPAECSEKSGAIVVMSLVSRVSREVTALLQAQWLREVYVSSVQYVHVCVSGRSIMSLKPLI